MGERIGWLFGEEWEGDLIFFIYYFVFFGLWFLWVIYLKSKLKNLKLSIEVKIEKELVKLNRGF